MDQTLTEICDQFARDYFPIGKRNQNCFDTFLQLVDTALPLTGFNIPAAIISAYEKFLAPTP